MYQNHLINCLCAYNLYWHCIIPVFLLRYTNNSTNDSSDSQNNSSHQTQSRDIRDYRTGVRSLPFNNRTRRVVFSTETFKVRYNTICFNRREEINYIL